MNVFDYCTWRGDLTFAQDEVRAVDCLLFSCISYIRFEPLFEDEKSTYTLKEAAQAFQQLPADEQIARVDEDIKLLYAMASTPRYQEVELTHYIAKLDEKREKQFSAISFSLAQELQFIIYRGTDNTLVGWKEDFNMTFKETVPSQIEALHYFREVSKQSCKRIYLAGHSKGGNLAVYAAAHASKKMQAHIQSVYNFDGPGFMKEEVERDGYQNILKRIHTFVPQSSIIGMMLDHEEVYTIVHSTQISLWQHDPYSWCFDGPHFEVLNTRTTTSYLLDTTIRQWITQLEPQKREAFVDAMFEVVNATNANSIKEMNTQWFRSTAAMLKSFKNLDEQEKKVMMETIYMLLSNAKQASKDLWENHREEKKRISEIKA